MYRVGFPFWRTLARRGVQLKIRIYVLHDEEAGVFVAHSNDLRGLVAEAPTIEALVKEINSTIDDLLEEELRTTVPSKPATDMRLCAA